MGVGMADGVKKAGGSTGRIVKATVKPKPVGGNVLNRMSAPAIGMSGKAIDFLLKKVTK